MLLCGDAWVRCPRRARGRKVDINERDIPHAQDHELAFVIRCDIRDVEGLLENRCQPSTLMRHRARAGHTVVPRGEHELLFLKRAEMSLLEQ